MGTTLTGTTPQDTYDSLIKVTDNGPLSGTAKYLSDGLGNDSVLALSTGNIGIGTTSPSRNLHILGGAGIGTVLKLEAGSGAVTYLQLAYNGATNAQSGYISYDSSANMGLFTNDTERMRITSAGNVGIGTSSPSTKLTIDNSANSTTRAIDLVGNASTAKGHLGYFADNVYLSSNYFFDSGQNYDVSGLGQALVVVSASATNSSIQFATSAAGSTAPTIRATIDADGLKFGTDTAAANALDDYEEGTWTMGVAFGGASVGVTYGNQTAYYTKIGNVVTVNGYLYLTSKGTSTGNATITGLPFTNRNVAVNFSPTTFGGVVGISFADQLFSYTAPNTTTIQLFETTNSGVQTSLTNSDFTDTSEIMFSLSYQA